MKIVIAGGTGLVGKRLQQLFLKEHAEIIILTTSNQHTISDGVRYVTWMNGEQPEHLLENTDAFINLAGVSLNAGRWTAKQKTNIEMSRTETTQEIIRIMKALVNKPKVFVNASAVGIYEPSTSQIYSEQYPAKAHDFLSNVVMKWESEANKANILGIRTCLMRFGVILEKEAGALPLMLLPYQLFIGGTIGSGKQWVSWIHAEDAARAILHAIQNEQLSGPINTVSPNAKRMRDFGKTIGKTFNRPHYLPVPSFALKSVLGEKSILILEGQYVVPDKLLQTNFKFKFASLENALLDLYN
jgi:uncharacterized protein